MFVERRYLFKKGRVGEPEAKEFGLKYEELYQHKLVDASLRDFFSSRVQTPWENWVFLTYACNLDCAYCFEKGLKGELRYSVEDLVNFLVWESKERPREYYWGNSRIVFYGGEPIIKLDLIKEIIQKVRAQELPIDFALVTNGTLMDKLREEVLEELKVICVSVDGTEEIHDKNRVFKDGRGSYKVVMKNLGEVKKRYGGRLLARITLPVTDSCSLFESIAELAGKHLFTDFYWQLEKPIEREVTENEVKNFCERYKTDMKKVVDFWGDKIKQGEIVNLIPLETIFKRVLQNTLIVDFRAGDEARIKSEASGLCGCGRELVAISLDGECYACDTLIGRKEAKIGDIWKGVNPHKFIEKNDFWVYGDFKGCPRMVIKGKLELNYSKKHTGRKGCPLVSGEGSHDVYCHSAQALAGAVTEKMEKILLDTKNIEPEDFFSPVADFTEQLP